MVLEQKLYLYRPNGFRDIQWRMRRNSSSDLLKTTSKQRSRSFILVPIDFSYTLCCQW